MSKWEWLKKVLRILLATGIAANLAILLAKAFLGDQLFIKGIKTRNYYNPAICLCLLCIFLLLLCKDKLQKANVHLLVVLAFVLIIFSFFQNDYYPLRVEGDGVGYFAYLHSLYFDKDLDFLDEYRALHAVKYGVHGWIDQWGNERYPWVPKTWNQANSFSIGPALLWYPFYHLADRLYRGRHPERTGYEPFYLNVLRFGHLVYGLLAVILLYFTLATFFKPLPSFLSILVILFMSPAYYYLKNSTFYSHILSFFTISLFLFVFVRMRNKANPFYWAILGCTAGLFTLVRWQNAANILLVVFFVCFDIFKDKTILRRDFLRGILKIAVFLFFFALFTLPQIVAFQIIYGSPFIIPQGGSFVTAFPTWIGQALFSSFHGLFYWHPLLLLGVIGFFLKYKGRPDGTLDRSFFYTNGLGFGLQTYINSSLPQFWAGAAFGARRFVDAFGFLAHGTANFFAHIMHIKIIRRFFIPLLYLFSLFNIFLEKAYSGNSFPAEKPAPYTTLLPQSLKSLAQSWKQEPKMVFFLLLFAAAVTFFVLLLSRRNTTTAPGEAATVTEAS